MAMQLSRLEILRNLCRRSQQTVLSGHPSGLSLSSIRHPTRTVSPYLSPRRHPSSFRKYNRSMQIRAVDEDRPEEIVNEIEASKIDDQNQTAKENDAAAPNYAVWIISLVSVIGVFYALVFYAGTGLIYLLAKKIQFKKKDFVPYSVKLEQERQAMQQLEAPSVVDKTEDKPKTNEDIN